MLVIMRNDATMAQVEAVIGEIERQGYRGLPIPGAQRTAVCIVGNQHEVDDSRLLSLEGVKETIRVTKPYKLVSRETHPQPTVITVGAVTIGGGQPVVMAGPCAVESEEQTLAIARIVKKHGAQVFRGGAFKPRSSPYTFQGLGEAGLRILAKVRQETGLPVVTEATDHDNIEMVEEYADIIQIGARNMQNYSLLRRAGLCRKPVLLKRGFAATIEELLMSAEYIASEGQPQCDTVRARDQDLLRQHPEHAGPLRHTVDQGGQPPSGHRRSQPRRRAAGVRHRPVPGGHRRGRRRPPGGGAPRSRPCPLRRAAVPVPGAARRADEGCEGHDQISRR